MHAFESINDNRRAMLLAEWSQTMDRDIRLGSKGRDHAFFGWAGPRSNQYEQRQVCRQLDDGFEKLARRGIDPLKILDHQQAGATRGHALQLLEHQLKRFLPEVVPFAIVSGGSADRNIEHVLAELIIHTGSDELPRSLRSFAICLSGGS